MTEYLSIKKTALEPSKLKDINPEGWYLKQLMVQKNGLTGHLEEIWKDLGPSSGWLGGTGESWERGPYYLDGLVPLAYLLRDETLEKKAQKWIEWILESQNEDGFFGPYSNNDWWPRIVALKAIVQYHSATEDKRILPFMDRFFKYQLQKIDERPFEMWGTSRGFEELLPIFYLYSYNNEHYLLELADKVLGESYDWGKIFNDFPYVETTHKYLNKQLFVLVKRLNIFIKKQQSKRKPRPPKVKTAKEIKKENNSKNLHLFHETHSVNIAMAFKMPVLKYLLTGDVSNLETARKGIYTVMKYHGLSNHAFSGDEHLNGHSPNVGAELCLVAEYMHSLETMLTITGESMYADILEQVAFNAWPATFLQDMNAHQYVQQVNQVEVSKKKRGWYDGFNESNIFGLEPNYGCCTANMHQGWPKLSGCIIMKNSKGVTTGIYAPCRVRVGDIVLREITEYPFDGVVEILVEKIEGGMKKNFQVLLRIPSWCRKFSVYINEREFPCESDDGYVKIQNEFCEGDRIRLDMELEVQYLDTGRGSCSIHCGPLLMSLAIKGRMRKLRGVEPFADWEIFPASEWRYAVVKDRIPNSVISKHNTGDRPFGDEDPALTLTMKMAPTPQWQYKRGNAGRFPEKYKIKKTELDNIKLVPFGCTRLRIAEFPMAEIMEDDDAD